MFYIEVTVPSVLYFLLVLVPSLSFFSCFSFSKSVFCVFLSVCFLFPIKFLIFDMLYSLWFSTVPLCVRVACVFLCVFGYFFFLDLEISSV